MTLEEKTVKELIKRCVAENEKELIELHKQWTHYECPPAVSIADLKKISETPFRRISYTNAIKMLMKASKEFEVKPMWGMDLGKEHEHWLAREGPVFVHDFPSQIKSFYMYQNYPFTDGDIIETAFAVEVDDTCDLPLLRTCKGVDLLIPSVGELCGGAIREHRYEFLERTMRAKKMDMAPYREYLDLRKQGTIPHGGYGLGFDRLLMMITGAPHIRDCTIHPRYFGV